MKLRISTNALTAATLLALAACSNLALADDPPARVGRVALAQGQVSISSVGEAATPALVNWPVTSNNTISTAPGARTELRIGSTTIRLDGDSALDVVRLDDDSLRLRYGSASVSVVDAELAAGFELSTPQTRVLLQQPGRVRIDAGRERDTSSVNVFEGVAIVEGGGERLTVRAGRRADMQGDDLRTSQAMPDAFDDWVAGRDRQIDRVLATRYVPAEMTGYEDLDRYGSWQSNTEYGNLWLPAVDANWVPYRDGRWSWIAPWGWTWVDNAPWGYAPFHYGRWVHVNRRWAWAPGRLERRPVWAPALVGWVGGAGWQLDINARPTVAQGWYPLSPHERFVPGYRLPEAHLRRLNERHDGRRDGRDDGRDYRWRGLTVVPHERFGQRSEIVVPREARVTAPPSWVNAPHALPLAPQDRRAREWRAERRDEHDGRRWERRDGDDRNDRWSGRPEADGERRRAPVTMPAPVLVTQPASPGFGQQPGIITTSPPPPSYRDTWRERRDAPREDAAPGVIATPRTPVAPPPAPVVVRRGGMGGAIEAARAQAAQQAQQAQPQPQPATAVAAPQRAQPGPTLTVSPRIEQARRLRQMEP